MRHFTENAESGSFKGKPAAKRGSETTLRVALANRALPASCYSAQLFQRKTAQT
jgi:hypothetical protein